MKTISELVLYAKLEFTERDRALKIDGRACTVVLKNGLVSPGFRNIRR